MFVIRSGPSEKSRHNKWPGGRRASLRITRTATPARAATTGAISPHVRARICFRLGRKPSAQDRAGSGCPSCSPCASEMHTCEDVTSTAACRLDCGDVDLFHLHHRIERALGGSAIGIGYRFCQSQWCNLPGQAPFVLAPAARTLSPPLPTIAFQ